MVVAEGAHAEVHAAVDFVGVAVGDDFLDGLDLFHDVARGCGLNGRTKDVEHIHHVVEVVGVLLHHLHRLEVFEAGLLANLVFPVVRVACQVADVGDVAHVANLEAEVLQVAVHDVKRQEGPNVSEVNVAVHRRPAHIHAHERGIEWLKFFFLPGQAVADVQGVHGALSSSSEHENKAQTKERHTFSTGLSTLDCCAKPSSTCATKP